MAAGQIRAPMIIPLKDPQSFKSQIITNKTKFEINSDSSDVDVYFTIDGSKPEPFRKPLTKSTIKYYGSFYLPHGKRVIKAIAVSKDKSRESNVVTKIFEVKLENGDNENEEFEDDTYGYVEDLKKMEYQKFKPKNSETTIRYNSEESPKVTGLENEHNAEKNINKNNSHRQMISKFDPKAVPVNNYSQSLKLHREVDFMKCSYCMSARPSDPNARFCQVCGQSVPPLPQFRLPPPEDGQLGVCVHCRSTVPMTVMNCLICEAPLQIQNSPQASINLKEKILCYECGTTNPPNIDSCLTCESFLLQKGKRICIQDSKPPESDVVENESILKKCMKCMRQNNYYARYCDWCGNVLSAPNSNNPNVYLTCLKCNANNTIEAVFCCQCGQMMINPNRDQELISNNNYSSVIRLPLYDKNDDTCIIKNPIRNRKFVESETQTVGLFYPSSAKIKTTEEKDNKSKNIDNWMKYPVSTVSPGKGYWRKQIDHVVTHLKAHASNNAEFQTLIGEPRMGKLISANIEEEDYEMNLILTFSLKGYKDPYQREVSENFERKYLSSLLKRTNSFDSFHSDNTIRSNGIQKYSFKGKDSNEKQLTKRTISSRPTSAKITHNPNQDLLKEIGKNGSGREHKIQELFEQQADPKSKTKKGIPYLTIAIKNKHFDAAMKLIKLGADVNASDNDHLNSALHEAVMLGNSFASIVALLIDCGADIQLRNKNGESPLDLAKKVNNDAAIDLISANLGKLQMEKNSKASTVDTDL